MFRGETGESLEVFGPSGEETMVFGRVEAARETKGACVWLRRASVQAGAVQRQEGNGTAPGQWTRVRLQYWHTRAASCSSCSSAGGKGYYYRNGGCENRLP
jgi:hypothetical protein